MKEDEIIEKLENADLPDIEIQGHRRQLRTALLLSRHFKQQTEGGFLNSIRAWITGVLVAPRPVWQTALISTFVIMTILCSGLIYAILSGQINTGTQPEWLKHLNDIDNGTVFQSSLAFDASGNPTVNYWDSSTQDLKLARWKGSSWNIQTVDAESGGSVAFDPSGTPAIAYRSYLADVLKYAFLENSKWVILTVDFGKIQEISLSYGATGNHVIRYSNVSTSDVKSASWNGSSWDIETIES